MTSAAERERACLRQDSTLPCLRAGAEAWGWIALLLITLLAAVVRFHDIGARGLWIDEGFSVAAARLPWREFLALLRAGEANMALYYVLLRGWLCLGESEGFIRSLSALFSVASIPLIYLLGRRLISQPAGIAAALLLALNAFHLGYAQEARSYALLFFLIAAATLLLVQAVESAALAVWLGYAGVSTFALYTHFLYAFILLAHVAAVLVARPRNLRWRHFAGMLALITVLSVPAGLAAWSTGTARVRWVAPPTSASLGEALTAVAGEAGYPLLLLTIGACLLGTMALLRRGQRWPLVLLGSLLLVPAAVLAAVSLVTPVFISRYLFICMPGLVLLAACALEYRMPVLRYAVFLCVLVFAALGTLSYLGSVGDVLRADWREATRFLLAQASPADGVIFYSGTGRATYEYYRRRAHQPGPEVVYPAYASPHRNLATEPAEQIIPTLDTRHARLWLFLAEHQAAYGHDPTARVVAAWCAHNYPRRQEYNFPGIKLLRYSR